MISNTQNIYQIQIRMYGRWVLYGVYRIHTGLDMDTPCSWRVYNQNLRSNIATIWTRYGYEVQIEGIVRVSICCKETLSKRTFEWIFDEPWRAHSFSISLKTISNRKICKEDSTKAKERKKENPCEQTVLIFTYRIETSKKKLENKNAKRKIKIIWNCHKNVVAFDFYW